MINDHTLARFERLGEHLLRPIYSDYSFANLPATLHYLLTGEETGPLLPADCFGGAYPKPKRIVLLFVDSFGWRFWRRYADHSRLMRRVMEDGVLTPISALFPSTTSASVSTLNLGTPPARHGVYEWYMYVPAFGETIQSLPFATLGENAVSCVEKGFDIARMVTSDGATHQRLKRHGVRSIQLAHCDYAFSAYNRVVSAGAEVVPHRSLPEALVHLRDVLETKPDKALINLYWAGLDTAAHLFGPNAPEHEAEVKAFWAALDALLPEIDGPETLLFVTADHGQTAADAADTLYVNERFPELRDCLATSPTGRTIWPNGSPRDMFLHVEAERRVDVYGALREGLTGVAEVLTVDDAVDIGLFGPAAVSEEFRSRLGDVLVLPYAGRFVWWREPGIVENNFHGHHGGLAAEELITAAGVLGG